MSKYLIEGLGEVCPLCIEATDGRGKEKRPPVFLVGCEGGYTGAVCAPHLAALIKAAEGPVSVKPATKPTVEPTVPRPAVAAALPPAVPMGNGAK